MSQEQFATRIGTNKGNVENYEMGRARLPERLAQRIGALSGVIPQTLHEGQPLTNYNGQPFSKETFQRWKSLGYNQHEAAAFVRMAYNTLETLFEAAIGPVLRNTPHLFRELMIDLNDFIFSRAERLQLVPVIDAMFRAKHSVQHWKAPVSVLRERFGDHPEWQAKDNPAWSNSCKAAVAEQFLPVFEPFMTFTTRDGRPAFVNLADRSRRIYDIEIEGERFQIVTERFSAHYLVPRHPALAAVPTATPPSPRSSPAPAQPPAKSARTSSMHTCGGVHRLATS